MLNYFHGAVTLEQIKSRYRDLALLHHPDRGGDTRRMQDINAEFAFVLSQATRAAKPGHTEEQYASMDAVNETIRHAVEAIIGLAGIEIEICGLWVWVTGDTRPVKESLKAARYRFSPKKACWYFAGIPCQSKQSHSMDYIRGQYGSQRIQQQQQEEQRHNAALFQ